MLSGALPSTRLRPFPGRGRQSRIGGAQASITTRPARPRRPDCKTSPPGLCVSA